MSNIEPQNDEGWNRCALPFYKLDRIHYFNPPVAEYSRFDIRNSLFTLSVPCTTKYFINYFLRYPNGRPFIALIVDKASAN